MDHIVAEAYVAEEEDSNQLNFVKEYPSSYIQYMAYLNFITTKFNSTTTTPDGEI